MHWLRLVGPTLVFAVLAASCGSKAIDDGGVGSDGGGVRDDRDAGPDAQSPTDGGAFGEGGASDAGGDGASALLFQDDFESCDFSAWDGYFSWPADNPYIARAPEPVHSGSCAYGQHYFIAAGTDSGASSQDYNRYLFKRGFNQTHLFTRGYVYIDVPGGDVTTAQRKLMWWQNDSKTSVSGYDYSPILDAWPASPDDGLLHLSMTANAGPGCTAWQDWNLAALELDRWYEIEVEIRLDDPGADNGYYNMWVDGVLVGGGTGKCFRGTNTDPIQIVSFGRQTNRYSYAGIDEHRYWDDIAVSERYIGP